MPALSTNRALLPSMQTNCCLIKNFCVTLLCDNTTGTADSSCPPPACGALNELGQSEGVQGLRKRLAASRAPPCRCAASSCRPCWRLSVAACLPDRSRLCGVLHRAQKCDHRPHVPPALAVAARRIAVACPLSRVPSLFPRVASLFSRVASPSPGLALPQPALLLLPAQR